MAIKFLSTVAVDSDVLYVNAATNKVGIGDATPNYKLDVNSGTTNAALRLKSTDDTVTLRFEDDDSSYEIRESAVGLKFVNSSGSTDVTFLQSGDTGIGVTTPRAKLDVNGGVKVADDADTAALNKVGTLRYRYVPGSPKNFSYVDMCMQTGTNSYDWVNIVQNVWN